MSTRNFQSVSGEQGFMFERHAVKVLEYSGFEVVARHVALRDAGVEVDIIATNQDGVSFYVTCKGSWRGPRPGCQRTDTLKKAIAEAYALHQNGWAPVLLLTTHLPNTRSGSALLASVDPEILFDAVTVEDSRRLRWLARATEAQLRADMAKRQRPRPACKWQLVE